MREKQGRESQNIKELQLRDQLEVDAQFVLTQDEKMRSKMQAMQTEIDNL